MELKMPCEVYSRVVGYMRPVGQWNKGKQAEFKDRKSISMDKITSILSTERMEKENENHIPIS